MEEMLAHLVHFHKATNSSSGSKYPTLNEVLPIFITLFCHIEREIGKDDVDEVVKEALTEAHKVLAKYYSFSDDAPFYIASVLLDPRIKKSVFINARFEDHYPGVLENAMNFLANACKKYDNDNKEQSSTAAAESRAPSIFNFYKKKSANAGPNEQIVSYFSLPVEDEEVEPLQWWSLHQKWFKSLSQPDGKGGLVCSWICC